MTHFLLTHIKNLIYLDIKNYIYQCKQTRKTLFLCTYFIRSKRIENDEFYFKSQEEMIELLKDIPSAIAKKCSHVVPERKFCYINCTRYKKKIILIQEMEDRFIEINYKIKIKALLKIFRQEL